MATSSTIDTKACRPPGAVKIPVRDGEVAIGEYDIQAGKTMTTSSTKYITVTMKDIAGSELIDAYEAAAVPDNLRADRLDSMGYSFAKELDADALKVLVNAIEGKDENGVAFTSTDVRYNKTGHKDATTPTKATIYSQIVALGTALDEADVPGDGRWLILSPAAYALLISDDNFVKKGDISQELVMAGAVGECNGFTVFKSNNLPTTSDSKKVFAIAGHPDFCTRIEEWAVNPSIEDIKDGKHIGASAVQGRKAYKHAVTKPQALAAIVEGA